MIINPPLAASTEASNAPGTTPRHSSGASFAGILALQTAAGDTAIPVTARQINEPARVADPEIAAKMAQLKSAIIAAATGGKLPEIGFVAAAPDQTATAPREAPASVDPAIADKMLQFKNAIIAAATAGTAPTVGFVAAQSDSTASTASSQSTAASAGDATVTINSNVPWGSLGSVTGVPVSYEQTASGPNSLNDSNALWGVAQWAPGTEPNVSANEWYNPGWFWENPGNGSGPIYVQRTNAYGGLLPDSLVQWVDATGAMHQGVPATGSWNGQAQNQLA